MKKKGLIISTVVMAVVLIASLTTATYAWFSSSASTLVDSMTIKVAAASDVSIGLASTSSKVDDNSYMYGTVSLTDSAIATGGEPGLGTQLTINFGSSSTIMLQKAVATANNATSGAAITTSGASGTAIFNPSSGNAIITGNSANVSGVKQEVNDKSLNPTSIASATVNKDYIYLDMAARANKSDLYGITCNISITTQDKALNLKDNAALHFYIVNGTKTQEIDVFGTYTNGTKKSTISAAQNLAGSPLVKTVTYAYNSTSGEVTASFSFDVVPQGATALDYVSAAGITNFQIYAYIFGPDLDCTSAGTGTSVSFDMNFTAYNTAKTV